MLLHGDAAFAGEGIVAETLNLSQLPGYTTGGTIHIIINNQLGFTTPPEEGRSSTYSTDIAKMIQAPIFHVNSDDVEAAYNVLQIALDYRQKFKKDVVIDVIGFRRLGHNEGDEPTYTQPVMYQRIREHPGVRALYAKKLVAEGVMTEEEVATLMDERNRRYENAQLGAKAIVAKQGTATRRFSITSPSPKSLKSCKRASIKQTLRDDCARDHNCAARLQLESEDRRLACAPREDGRRRGGGRLGHGRSARVWLAADRRHARAAHGSGHGSRARSAIVTRLSPIRKRAQEWAPLAQLRGRREVRNLRQPSVGSGRARIRVRLQCRGARYAGVVGSAIRRLHQRGSGDRRSVHRVGRREVESDEPASCCCCRTATKARARSIRARGSNASCSSARKGICRW